MLPIMVMTLICADISSGQSLNQVIEQLADNDCDLQEQIGRYCSRILKELKWVCYNFTRRFRGIKWKCTKLK